MEYYGENGLNIFCDNGLVADVNECPCGCPPFEGRSIVYVDKHATGTGDGSSWENAYTDIQTAINTHSRKEIQIKGYGENDCYPADIVLQECTYLKGIDSTNGSVWVDGTSLAYGIRGAIDYTDILGETQKVENLNVKNALNGFVYISGIIDSCKYKGTRNNDMKVFRHCIGKVLNCEIFDSGSTNTYGSIYGFYACRGEIENCHVNNISSHSGGAAFHLGRNYISFDSYGTITNCSCNGFTTNNNGGYGFYIDNSYKSGVCTLINCTCTDAGGGFFISSWFDDIFSNCTATDMYRDGFQLVSNGLTMTTTECSATNCGDSGFVLTTDRTGSIVIESCSSNNTDGCGFRLRYPGSVNFVATNLTILSECQDPNNYNCNKGYCYVG